MTPVLEGQLSQIWPFPVKKGVKRILGVYEFIYIIYINTGCFQSAACLQ